MPCKQQGCLHKEEAVVFITHVEECLCPSIKSSFHHRPRACNKWMACNVSASEQHCVEENQRWRVRRVVIVPTKVLLVDDRKARMDKTEERLDKVVPDFTSREATHIA